MKDKETRVLGRILAVEELDDVAGARPPLTLAALPETLPTADSNTVADSGTTADSGTVSDSGTTADSGTIADSGTTADSGTSADSGALTDTSPARRPDIQI